MQFPIKIKLEALGFNDIEPIFDEHNAETVIGYSATHSTLFADVELTQNEFGYHALFCNSESKSAYEFSNRFLQHVIDWIDLELKKV